MPYIESQLNFAQVHEAIAAAIPDRECIVFRDRRLTWAQVNDRTRRLANVLAGAGLGARPEGRAGLEGHESHQDHLAIYAYNGNEYLEAMVGAYKARLAPLNVNYRYVAEELQYLLDNSQARAIVYHSALAPTLAEVLPNLPKLQVLLQIADESGNDLLPGAQWYEEALAAASPELPACAPDWSPDDLYILYTGGTTGMPKGVLWRQADIFVSAMGGRGLEGPHTTESAVEAAKAGMMKVMPAAPFMHGAGHWIAFLAMDGGNTVVIQDVVDRLDPKDVLSVIEREKVSFLQIVGDAFGRPIVEEAETGAYDLSSLFIVLSGGAALSVGLKERFLKLLPQAMVVDGVGSSEGGGQMQQVSTAGGPVSTGTFKNVGEGTEVVTEGFTGVLDRSDDTVGWLATAGYVPLGYLGDPEKTAKTFPVIDGVRYSVPGDKARWVAPDEMELLGRDSVTINSGGEKIFAEEVEAALLHHPSVYDVVVCGRPSEKWGNEVIAIVQLAAGAALDEAALTATAAEHIARYKLPKAYVVVDKVLRSPSGKADYRWAKQVAADPEPAS